MMPCSFKQTESDAKEALDFFGKRGTNKPISSENNIYLEEESPVKKKRRKRAKSMWFFQVICLIKHRLYVIILKKSLNWFVSTSQLYLFLKKWVPVRSPLGKNSLRKLKRFLRNRTVDSNIKLDVRKLEKSICAVKI